MCHDVDIFIIIFNIRNWFADAYSSIKNSDSDLTDDTIYELLIPIWIYIHILVPWVSDVTTPNVRMSFHIDTLQWRRNGRDGVSHNQRLECLFNRSFGRRSKKTSKHRLCEGNSPVTGEFPSQRGSIAENVSIWWRHHEVLAEHLRNQVAYAIKLHLTVINYQIDWCVTLSRYYSYDINFQYTRRGNAMALASEMSWPSPNLSRRIC